MRDQRLLNAALKFATDILLLLGIEFGIALVISKLIPGGEQYLTYIFLGVAVVTILAGNMNFQKVEHCKKLKKNGMKDLK